MTPERYLQVCLATTVVLATLLLGMGQQNWILPGLALFGALTSVYFTDHLGWFRLNRHVANLAALGAVGYATLDFVETDPSTRLLAIANLLVYLQVILFYQEKADRHYWQLLVLSLLQVVVAAALNLGVEFGFLLGTYLFLALSSLGLLFVHCESRPFTSETILIDQNGKKSESVTTPNMGTSPQLLYATGRNDAYVSHRQLSLIEVSALNRTVGAMFNRGMVWQIVKLSIATIGLTFVIFFLTPRLGKSAWQKSVESDEQIVGFTDEISLNDVGTLLEDDTIVLRVHFETIPEGNPYKVKGEFYLRGAVLSEYRHGAGTWRMSSSRWDSPGNMEFPPDNPLAQVRQVIQTTGTKSLFSVSPAYAVRETPRNLRQHPRTFQLADAALDGREKSGSRFRYALATDAFHDGRQTAAVPCLPDVGLRGRARESCLVFDPEWCPKLADLAETLVEESGVSTSDPYRVAKALEAHFLRPGNYAYSLTSADLAPSGSDSTEFFVTETRVGHCEFFASALALMLRHSGIPARVVVGFRGGDLNEVGNYYQVKNLHAHAWVEAHMPAEYVPSSEIPSLANTSEGVWLRLDPTPLGGTGAGVYDEPAIVIKFRKVRDYVELLWSEYILGLDSERQRLTIYQPILTRTQMFFREVLFSRKWWRTFGSELVETLGMDSAAHFRRRWFNWHAAPILLGIILLLTAGYLLTRRLLARVGWWLISRPGATWRMLNRLRKRRRGLYPRMVRLLRRHGIRRRTDHTAMEFASEVTRELVRRDISPELAAIPQIIAQSYYRERFGHQPLDAHESHAVEHSLSELGLALSRSRGVHRSNAAV